MCPDCKQAECRVILVFEEPHWMGKDGWSCECWCHDVYAHD